MDGLLLVDKPAGWTSFDVVGKIRSVLANGLNVKSRKLKVGHSGTLDPLATGLLIILVGNYTKHQSEFMKLKKSYEGQVTFGASTDTDDGEGEVKPTIDAKPVTEQALHSNLQSFIGQQQQIPPQYSAIKVAGQRAYKQARRGQSVELKPRPITIHSIEVISYDWPKFNFRAEVSSGTYIRSIARDLGQKLGVGGYLSTLRRTSIGPFLVSDALTMSELSTKTIQNHLLQT